MTVHAFSQNRSFFAGARQERFNKLLWLATEGGLTRVAGRVSRTVFPPVRFCHKSYRSLARSSLPALQQALQDLAYMLVQLEAVLVCLCLRL